MRKAFYLIPFLFLVRISFSQQLVQNWKRHPLPSGDTIFQFNRSDTSWLVSLNTSGQIIAENKIATFPTADTLPFVLHFDTIQPFRSRGFRTVKKVFNGYLVGFNKGEWGGSLHWFSEKGDTWYMISGGNIFLMFDHKAKTWVSEGLAHLSMDEGELWEMSFSEGKWDIRSRIKLPSSPEIVLKDKGNILIITTNSIFYFDGTEKFEYIKRDAFWDILYPQSAVIVNNELFLGMRGGVYKINLKSKQEEWLMPE